MHKDTLLNYNNTNTGLVKSISAKNRIKWIDNAKGIAILLVIIGHTSSGLKGVIDFDFVFGIHLTMFFLLSGYTFKKKAIDSEFLNSKFRRLMTPYFYTCLAVMMMDIVNSYVLHKSHSIIDITSVIYNDLVRSFFASGAVTDFAGIEIGTRIGAIWFLPALFFAIILFQLILHISDSSLVRGTFSAGLSLTAYVTARFIWLPYSILSGMFAAFFLWIGYEIKERKLLDKVEWKHYVIAQAILLFGIYRGWCNISFVAATANDLILSIPVGLSGCMLIYGLSKIDVKGWILAYLGNISLIILCTHLFAMETLSGIFYNALGKFVEDGYLKSGLYLVIHILFACLAAAVIDKREAIGSYFKEKIHLTADKNISDANTIRDISIDIEKGILILLVVIGHFQINSGLRTVIYSFHMEAFILLSDYFYKGNRSLASTVKRMSITFLRPYCIAVASIVLLQPAAWTAQAIKAVITKYILGMSFSNTILQQVGSVGPIYFILLLFSIRLIYTFLSQKVENRIALTGIVLILSLIGVGIGNRGLWLPWSIDVACYSLVFYHIGRLCHEAGILKLVRENTSLYFLLAAI